MPISFGPHGLFNSSLPASQMRTNEHCSASHCPGQSGSASGILCALYPVNHPTRPVPGVAHCAGLMTAPAINTKAPKHPASGPSLLARADSGRRRVTREHEVAICGRLVAGEAGFVQRLVARFAVLEVGESPAAGRCVLFRVLDHELNILG